MTLEMLAEQKRLQQITPLLNAELVNKYSKYVKTIGKRVVEVEFCWFQAHPCQSLQLRMTEKQFTDAKKYIYSKKLINMKFEQFIDLIGPILANNATEITDSCLQSTFDCLFDQNTNGTIEQDEFDSLLILLKALGMNRNDLERKLLMYENLRQTFKNHNEQISFKDFCEFVRHGYVREILMH